MTERSDALAELTHALLREVLHYDPETGVFTWVDTECRRLAAGDEAGFINKRDGYRHINIGNRDYRASRIAWLYMTGAWPTHTVDHENRIKTDNRWCNLRAATKAEQSANRGLFKNNKSGLKGVRQAKNGNWVAGIRVKGKRQHLGTYATPEAAAAAYAAAATLAFGDFAGRS